MAGAARATIIKRVEADDHDGHHGGAWKVAYADFMTAMMAFFLLLWILSSSDEQKLRGIAEYFTDATEPGGLGVLDGASLGPQGTLTASNGAILARGSELGEEDQTVIAKWEVRDVTPKSEPKDMERGSANGDDNFQASGGAAPAGDTADGQDQPARRSGAGQSQQNSTGENTNDATARAGTDTGGAGDAERAADTQRFANLQDQLMQAMQANPDLRPLMENVIFEQTDQGLRIQVIDQEGKPMFASGSAEMLGSTRQLIDKLGESLAQLPNRMVITGHTDALPFSGRSNYDNWDLSSDRANATRRVLLNAGVERNRLLSVTGKAYTEPLVADAPTDPSNRRITVLLQYSDAPLPAAVDEARAPTSAATPTPVATSPQSDSNVTLLDGQTLEKLRSVLR